MKCDYLVRDNVAFVLVETITAGNIGSVARAMKNMGFSDLRLVNPQADHLSDNARWMAHGSLDILENAKVFPSFEKAISDCTLLVASSHKEVRNSQNCYRARELGPKLIPYCNKNKIAIVFGKEDHGLSNAEINRCTWLVNIPAASPYPALNMSQAAMLLCYELYMTSIAEPVSSLPKFVDDHAMELFYDRVLEMLHQTDFHHKNGKPEIFIGTLRRIFARTGFEERDLKVMYKLFAHINKSYD